VEEASRCASYPVNPSLINASSNLRKSACASLLMQHSNYVYRKCIRNSWNRLRGNKIK
jgi:hypothetical protein